MHLGGQHGSQNPRKTWPKPLQNRSKIDEKSISKSFKILDAFSVAFWRLLGPTWPQLGPNLAQLGLQVEGPREALGGPSPHP